MVQQALQIGGQQNVHAGRGGLEELPLCGVSTGGEEIGQHVVLVGSADQLAHRQTHLLCVITGEDIAEVAGGHAEVHLVTEGDLACLEQLGVGGKIVDDLRHKTAPVDGVCAGKTDVALFQLGSDGLIAEHLLYAGLGIVEVAAHSVHSNVSALLRCHLQTLDLAGAASGVEYGNLHTGDIMVAVQRSLTGVAAGGHKDQGLFSATQILFGLHQQLGHQLQGVILKGAGRAVPQLEGIGVPFHRGKIACLAAKSSPVGAAGGLGQEGGVVIGQVLPHNGCCQRGVVQPAQSFYIHLRKTFRHKQTALIGQPLCNCLRRSYFAVLISGTEKLHGHRSFSPRNVPGTFPVVRQNPRFVAYFPPVPRFLP